MRPMGITRAGHQRRWSPLHGSLGGPCGWPSGSLGSQGCELLFDTGVADQSAGVLAMSSWQARSSNRLFSVLPLAKFRIF